MPRIPVAGTHIPKPYPAGTPARRFRVASTIDGYEVVDQDGRAVSNSFVHANRPLEIAADLNAAAEYSKSALRRALGAAYAEDDEEDVFYLMDDGSEFDYGAVVGLHEGDDW